MREEIQESVTRLTKDDCTDIMTVFGLKDAKKATIRAAAFKDEDIAEYVLNY